jgi:hypothetical protein
MSIIDLEQGTFAPMRTSNLDFYVRRRSSFGWARGLPADTTTRKGIGEKQCPIDKTNDDPNSLCRLVK